MTERGRDTREPMIPINHSGYGIKVKDLVTYALIIIGGVSFAVTGVSRLDALSEQVHTQTTNTQEAIDKLSEVIETARKERTSDIKSLEGRVSRAEVEGARVSAQVNNLEKLMEDLRDLMRRQEEDLLKEDRNNRKSIR